MTSLRDALIDTLAPDWPPLPSQSRAAVVAHAAQFVDAQLAVMPFVVRVPAAILAVAFGLFAFMAGGARPFARQALLRRRVIVGRWSRLAYPFRGYIRLVRSMAMLAYLEHDVVRAAVGIAGPAIRMQTFREKRLQLTDGAP